MNTDIFKDFKECICDCPKCREACYATRPCFGTPQDIQSIINRGLSDHLMLDWWQLSSFDICDVDFYILAPAIKGWECKVAPSIPVGECSFYSANKGCVLHELQIKPSGGRFTSCKLTDTESSKLQEIIAQEWNTSEGRDVVRNWRISHLRRRRERID